MKILGFGLVGGVGFLVDGGVLTLLAQLGDANLFLARGVSFSLATLATWQLNRRYVFSQDVRASRAAGVEYAKYLVVQICGALFNLAVFAGLIISDPAFAGVPIVPLAIGALFGLVINFLGARYWVFRSG
jgi:putative flippase GtrA